MEFIENYLNSHVALLLFLCLGLGYLVGKIKIKSFVIGATAGTLLVGIIISQFVSVEIADSIKTIFFSLFCFTIGFDVGPSFFRSLKTSGIKLIGLSVFFTFVAILATFGAVKLFNLDEGSGIGLIAGAITQTSIIGAAQLGDGLKENATVVYGLTYVFGTIGVIMFVKNIAPLILKKKLKDIVKNKVDSMKGVSTEKFMKGDADILQTRAYVVNENSEYCGIKVEQLEERFEARIEVEAIYRGNDVFYDADEVVIVAGDVLQLIGNIGALNKADESGLSEVSDAKYYKVKTVDAKIVLTADFVDNGREILSDYGIILKDKNKELKKDSIIAVSGSEKAIKKAAKVLGYVKDEGEVTDIAFVALATCVGLIIGALALEFESFSLSLGESVGVLLSGLLCGWWCDRRPKAGHIPQATRIFLKNVGLNFYIAVLALSVGDKFFAAMSENGWLLILIGVVVTLIPHIASLLFGKYVMKIDEAELLGGLCGCGTCTAALNALSDETGSSVFALGYAPGCAAGNILLTLSGIILPMIL